MAEPQEQANEKVVSVTTTTMRVEPSYEYEEEYRPGWVWVLVVFPCLMPAFWRYFVRLSASELSVGFSCGCARLLLDRTDIVSAEVVPEIRPLLDWGGYGVRKQLPDWETGYITEKGTGVRLLYRKRDENSNNDQNAKEIYVTFSCRDPQTLCDRLNRSGSK